MAILASFTVFIAGMLGPFLATALQQYQVPEFGQIDRGNIGVLLRWAFQSVIRLVAQLLVFLLRAFGECDVIHEEVARREDGFGCKALALLQTDTVPDDVAKLIVRFVEDGGLLLCDRIPTLNENGKPCKLTPDLFPKPPVTTKTRGKGKAILLPSELDAALARALASPKPALLDVVVDREKMAASAKRLD